MKKISFFTGSWKKTPTEHRGQEDIHQERWLPENPGNRGCSRLQTAREHRCDQLALPREGRPVLLSRLRREPHPELGRWRVINTAE